MSVKHECVCKDSHLTTYTELFKTCKGLDIGKTAPFSLCVCNGEESEEP